jgi:DNA-binding beta-propeller fold protein YncE
MTFVRTRILTATLLAAGLAGCELSSNLDEHGGLVGKGFSDQIQPMLDLKCGGCHGGSAPDAGLALSSWSAIFQGSDFGDVVVPFSAERSLLLRLAGERTGGPHPGELGADTLSQVELDALRAWIDEGAPNDEREIAFADADELLYVANQDAATVTIIDMLRNVVARVVDLTDHGYPAAAKPHHVAVEPDGAHWYVSLIGANRVAKFDRQNNLVGDFEFETPGMLAIDPTDDYLYVGRSLSASNPPASIGKVRRSDMTGELIPVVFPRPHALTADPNGAFIYSASLGQNQLIVYETDSGDVTFASVAGPIHSFVQHAMAPDGGVMASTAQLTNQVLFFDLTAPDEPAFEWSVGVNAGPWHPVFSADGRFLYAGNKDADTVTIVSVDGRRVEAVIAGNGLAQPHGSAISEDGQTLYISNRNSDGSYTPRHDVGDNALDGTVVVIDLGSRQITKVLEVGALAAGMGKK